MAPSLGRVLGAVAWSYADSGQPMTAEGLYRSALDKLNNPFGANDVRFGIFSFFLVEIIVLVQISK